MMKHSFLTVVIILTVIVAFIFKNTPVDGILYGVALSIIFAMTFLSIVGSLPQFRVLRKLRAGGFKAKDKSTRIKNFVSLIEEQNHISKKMQRIIVIIGVIIVFITQVIFYLEIENKILLNYIFEFASCIAIIFFFLSSYCQFEISKIVLNRVRK